MPRSHSYPFFSLFALCAPLLSLVEVSAEHGRLRLLSLLVFRPYSAKEPFLISLNVGALLDASAAAAQAPKGTSALMSSLVACEKLTPTLEDTSLMLSLRFWRVVVRSDGRR
jgi:hypothetical protein